VGRDALRQFGFNGLRKSLDNEALFVIELDPGFQATLVASWASSI
jgi:hypothetical protein